MNRIEIPESFELFGREIQVNIIPDLAMDTDDIGEAKLRYDEIRLQKSTEGYPISRDRQMQCYYHELTHFILNEMDYIFRNNKDEEKFVSAFSRLLYQAIKSAKYKL